MIAVPAVLVAAALVLLGLIDAGIVVSVVALLVLMAVPGAAVAVWTVPQARTTLAPRVLLAVGLGLALAVLIGVVLDRTPFGVRATPVVLAVLAVVSLAVLIPRDRSAWPRELPRVMTVGQASMLALSLVIAVSAFGISRWSARDTVPAELAQLWLVRTPAGTLEAGVTNDGRSAVTYRLVLRSGTADLLDRPSIVLQPGQSWRETVPPAIVPASALHAVLYRADDPATPFREVLMSNPKAGG